MLALRAVAKCRATAMMSCSSRSQSFAAAAGVTRSARNLASPHPRAHEIVVWMVRDDHRRLAGGAQEEKREVLDVLARDVFSDDLKAWLLVKVASADWGPSLLKARPDLLREPFGHRTQCG